MNNLFRIDDVETSLVTLLQTTMTTAYGANVDVDSLGDKDFDDEGTLVLRTPAVRALFLGAPYKPTHDNLRLTYEQSLDYDIFCFEQSLRSKADERLQTLNLVAVLLEQVVGARLTLTNGQRTMPITLRGVNLMANASGPVDQAYVVSVSIEAIAQFSGVNG